jgi:hypothetical protein
MSKAPICGRPSVRGFGKYWISGSGCTACSGLFDPISIGAKGLAKLQVLCLGLLSMNPGPPVGPGMIGCLCLWGRGIKFCGDWGRNACDW